MMNDEITFAQVRLVDSQGEFTGIMTSNQARARANEEGLDLVVIQDGDVPVCKIISYSKWKYQREKAKKDQQKKTRQNRQDIKELKMKVGIAEHDYNVRLRSAKKFLEAGDKVKLSIMFRGREIMFTEIGQELLTRFAGDLKDLSVTEKKPMMQGRTMQMMLNPLKSKAEVLTEKERMARQQDDGGKRKKGAAIDAATPFEDENIIDDGDDAGLDSKEEVEEDDLVGAEGVEMTSAFDENDSVMGDTSSTSDGTDREEERDAPRVDTVVVAADEAPDSAATTQGARESLQNLKRPEFTKPSLESVKRPSMPQAAAAAPTPSVSSAAVNGNENEVVEVAAPSLDPQTPLLKRPELKRPTLPTLRRPSRPGAQ